MSNRAATISRRLRAAGVNVIPQDRTKPYGIHVGGSVLGEVTVTVKAETTARRERNAAMVAAELERLGYTIASRNDEDELGTTWLYVA